MSSEWDTPFDTVKHLDVYMGRMINELLEKHDEIVIRKGKNSATFMIGIKGETCLEKDLKNPILRFDPINQANNDADQMISHQRRVVKP